MLDEVIYYLVGAMVVSGLQTIWFCSNFPIHIFKLFRLIPPEDDVYTWDEFQINLITRSDFFGELLTCTVCLSVWFSIGTALVQFYLLELSVLYVVSCVLSWPATAYLVYKIGNRNE